MTGWLDGKYLAFDVETTSRFPTEARVVTATTIPYRCGGDIVSARWARRLALVLAFVVGFLLVGIGLLIAELGALDLIGRWHR